MAYFQLPHPYQPPTSVRLFIANLLQEPYLKRHAQVTVNSEQDHSVDWTSISSNVIATVLGAAVITVVGAIFFTAYQVPRQQDLILQNQVQMKETMTALADRLDRVEANDRRQDERIVQSLK